jgi:hypothetical protein
MLINHMICTIGKEDPWKYIGEVFPTDIPTLLYKAFLDTPKHVESIITSFPDICLLHDENGCLPFHIALETGMQWSTTLMMIMFANSDHLGEVDPVTKFCPIALATAEPACDLRMINYLLQKNPKQLNFSANKNNKMRRSNDDDLGHKNKCQKLNL